MLDDAVFVEGHLVTHILNPGWGVGTVERVAETVVTVRFYAGSERVETLDPRELARYRYAKGDFIRSRSIGEQGIVNAVRDGPVLTTYDVRFAHGRRRIPEGDVLPGNPIDDPFDLLRDGQFGDGVAFVLALQARRLQYAYSYDELVSLSNARIELLPHQVFVAHRVLANTPPRFLLADEVGLGKTIEAGLIIKELRARGAARRVLIVVPSGLVPQWITELRSKFNEEFARIDSTTIGALVAMVGPEQLWTRDSIVTSLHLLRGNEAYIDAIAQQHWDLIIFDEAHHLRRSVSAGSVTDRRSTQAYRLAERLQGAASALLLLTATPMQLHPYELYSLIELLDPTLFPTYTHFERYRRTIPALNAVVGRLEHVGSLSATDRHELATDISRIFATAEVRTGASPADVLTQLEGPEAKRERLREQVEDLHRLTAVMMRNRKRVVFDDLQPRRAHVLSLEYSEAERFAYDEVTRYIQDVYNQAMTTQNRALGFVMVTYRKMLTSSSYALSQSLSRRIAKLTEIRKAGELQQRLVSGDPLDIDDEEELEELVARYDAAVLDSSPGALELEINHLHRLRDQLDGIGLDAKAASLLTALDDILAEPGEKVLIFTQFKETLEYLRRLVSQHYRTVVFYGGMETVQKEATVNAFRDPDGAQVMIATEAAGEGRNLQFCHVMINYDLPWNPMVIEQRIGRLDRIGQTRPVEIYNFAVAGTVEDRIMRVLHERIKIFESTIGNLDPILGDIERDVGDLLMHRHSVADAEASDFEVQLAQRVREAQEMETRLSDFILDRRSFRQDRVDAILERDPAFTHADLLTFMKRFMAWSGGQMRERSQGVFEIHPPHWLREQSGRDLHDTYLATFDPVLARERDQLEFIAFGHDLLDGIIAVCMADHDNIPARTATLLLESDEVAPGTAICAVYEDTFVGIRPVKRLRCVAVGTDGVHRPNLSARFPALALRAQVMAPDAAMLEVFEVELDRCVDAAERISATELEAERRVRSLTNEQNFQTERAKQSHYFAAKIESAQREIQRLEATLQQQRESRDENVRRVIPATQGRLTVAKRLLSDLEDAREQTLMMLDSRQSVSASSQLLAAAYVTVTPSHRRVDVDAVT